MTKCPYTPKISRFKHLLATAPALLVVMGLLKYLLVVHLVIRSEHYHQDLKGLVRTTSITLKALRLSPKKRPRHHQTLLRFSRAEWHVSRRCLTQLPLCHHKALIVERLRLRLRHPQVPLQVE